ncbi:MAG TPA: metalloregulator ArsR/SmtB family transcription factor [Thermoanaerobaculia bacterium]|nr:metalloregulator ArsR/SmtB family transcription factor [Thermoanaerobaculia bacterium]
MSDDRFAAAAATARALADPTRLAILARLARGERCVCELSEELGAAQSRLSFHLKTLKEAGLLVGRPEGRMTYYSLKPGTADAVRELLDRLTPAGRRGRAR